MQAIRLALVGLFTAITLLWLAAQGFSVDASRFWPLRADMVQFSGLLAVTAMSAALYLAIRPRWLEHRLGGLDKVYRLHKWLGIAALATAVTHWGWAQGPKWLVGLGWLQRPARRGAGQVPDGLLGWLHAQRSLAEMIGEWAFYLAAALIVLALIKQIPYRWFYRTHRWLAVLYLALVVHSVILMVPGYWPTPLGTTMAILLVAGTCAAGVSLRRRVGRQHQVVGRVQHLAYHEGNRVLQVRVALDGPWPGHQPGQFAFVTFDQHEGPHPFSLSSAWQDDGQLAFSIKGLGDYTRRLPTTLHLGDTVTVEGDLMAALTLPATSVRRSGLPVASALRRSWRDWRPLQPRARAAASTCSIAPARRTNASSNTSGSSPSARGSPCTCWSPANTAG